MTTKQEKLVLVAVLFLAALLRFYNLMWGDGFFFHPDEGNMARSVARMIWSKRLYPDFFAYGQLPLYIAYFFSLVFETIGKIFLTRSFEHLPLITAFTSPQTPAVTFPQAVFWLRFISASASVATVWFVYAVTRELIDARYGLVAACIATVTPGLIQAAHFGTTESILGLVCMSSVYGGFLIARIRIENPDSHSGLIKILYRSGVAIGAGIASKITGVYFLLPLGLGLLLTTQFIKQTLRLLIRDWTMFLLSLMFLITVAGATFVIGSPYHILAFPNFRGTSQYETEVATGKAPVFYTRQFENTIPVVFSLKHIFPYTLGTPQMIFGILGYVLLTVSLFAKDKPYLKRSYRIILILTAGGFFAANSFLYAKWTRFLTPMFPLMPVFSTYLLYLIVRKIRGSPYVFIIPLAILLIIPGIKTFFVYARQDVRIQASRWIYDHIPEHSYILSETANVVDIPLPVSSGTERIEKRYHTISFNFYELDANPDVQQELLDHLVASDYILIPSRRIFANRIAANYYRALFDGSLGFEPMAIITTYGPFDCASNNVISFPPSFMNSVRGFCIVDKLIKQGSPFNLPDDILFIDEAAEESWTVFDHPTVRVYRKTTPMTREAYYLLLYSGN